MRYISIILENVLTSDNGVELKVWPLQQFEIVSSTKINKYNPEKDIYELVNKFVFSNNEELYSIEEPYAIEDEKRENTDRLIERYRTLYGFAENSITDFKKKVKKAIGHDIKAGEKADFELENYEIQYNEFEYIDFLDEWLY